MSLDVYLTKHNKLTCECGRIHNVDAEEVYWANITHNLGKMAEAAGIYRALWRPEEIGVTIAGQLIPLLIEGLEKLKSDPAKYQEYNSSNGWGTYRDFIPFVEKYLAACIENPDAEVRASR